ncbi:peptidase domain-containing ABC transporter [Hymenobacter psoromatis]|uniref:peptidase domain-containing ABC transporter n=1 Tax=Hymenobacter psoromatis TaxID=1484116 RepID=UPI001CBF89D5|nr:peptidase domain-containing ABC transporter [Hymenobacter psoromatis]
MANKIKFYPQLESTDCGPSCLRMVLSYYNRTLTLNQIKSFFTITKVGISIHDIFVAAKSFGMDSLVVKISIEQLSEIPLPVILHWKQDHFIVLYGIVKKNDIITKLSIADPAYGKINLSIEDFENNWINNDEKGVALVLIPDGNFFEPIQGLPLADENVLKRVLLFTKKNIKGNSSSLLAATLFFLVAMITNWSLPIFFQKVIDLGIGHKNLSIVIILLLAQFAIILGNAVSDFANSKILLKVGFNIGIKMLKDFLLKVISLPISFFDNRINSDIIQRIDDQERLQSFLTYKLLSFIIAIANFIVFSGMIFYYNKVSFLICLTSSIFSITWMTLFLEKRKMLDYSRFSFASENKNNIYEIISGMSEIKINNAENKKINRWQEVQNNLNSIVLHSLNLNYYQLFGVNVLNRAKDVLIIAICADQVIKGKMTMGVIMTISYLLGQVTRPVEQIVDFIRNLQDATLSFERMYEVQQREEEKFNLNTSLPTSINNGFKIKDVSFKYPGSYNKLVINRINVEIPLNKTTAIVGASGSGKTTMLKLLLGFYYPQSGEILLDDIVFSELDVKYWRKQCGVVLQDGYIFSGTIGENISLSDTNIDEEKLISALNIACLHEFVLNLPMGYHTKIGRTGIELSGGQKQRLLIARAVYKNPTFIFFDEATSSLDANNERQIMINLQSFFKNKTVVVIAHRLSTVRNADQILVLEKGSIVESGTHIELINNESYYYNLIKNQLELGK